jgi:hypothetical protein
LALGYFLDFYEKNNLHFFKTLLFETLRFYAKSFFLIWYICVLAQ